jgi:DNA-directed RNA polymerase specialized sigma24 family protein
VLRGPAKTHSKGTSFTTTHWSVILAARTVSSADYREALGKLCETYWFPIYAYLRRRGHTIHEAEDLTQGFFATLMEKQGLHSVDPGKGRFRSYLLGALKHYLADLGDRARAEKRGGDYRVVSLDAQSFESRMPLESGNSLSPEQQFDRTWVLTILERAVGRLEAESVSHSNPEAFREIIRYLIPSDESEPYGVTAARLDMTEAAVKAAVYRLRRRYRELLKDEIAQTVSQEDQVEEEIRHLLGALSG